MTPQQNGTTANGANGHRAKRSTGRVVPAIPLALTRPKQKAKPLAKQDGAVKASTPLTSSQAVSEQGQNGGGDVEQQVRGGEVQKVDQLVVDEQQPQQEHGQQENTRPSTETPGSRGSAAMSLSNGATPEPVANKAPSESEPLTNGQAAASSSSPAATASPVSAKFDMRQIRTELPPAFVPSSEQETPISAASSQRRPPGLFYGHAVHPSTSSIVFGGNESSGSSPAPPSGGGSAFMPPPPQPQSYTHAHHASESQARHLQNGQPTGGFGSRQGFSPQHHPNAHMHFRYPPREHFTPNGAPAANGYGPRSRSGSHASSRVGADLQSPASTGLDQSIDSGKAIYTDGKAPFTHRPGPSFQQHMQPPPPAFPHPEMAAGFENAESMRDHVLSQFQNPALADCQLRISEQDGAARAELDCHRLILARSPRLFEIISKSDTTASRETKSQGIEVELKGSHLRIGPFIDSVRYLYGGPLPPHNLYNLAHNASTEDRVEVALQYIATGAWLNIHAVAQRGVEIAHNLLHWDTITPVLAFALDGGLGQRWPVEDGSEERTSTCSSDDSFTKPEKGGSPVHEPHSSALLTTVLEYAAHNLPPNFYIDSSAPQSDACPRLPFYPQRHQSNASRSDPRLSKIRFGEMSNDDHQRPSLATTIISSILLSLPFPLLKYLLEHPALAGRLGADTIGSIMRQVVNEREVRRQKALKARVASRGHEAFDPQQVQNLYWEEAVEPSHQTRAGFRLSRRRRGIDTPPTSSSETDASK